MPFTPDPSSDTAVPPPLQIAMLVDPMMTPLDLAGPQAVGCLRGRRRA